MVSLFVGFCSFKSLKTHMLIKSDGFRQLSGAARRKELSEHIPLSYIFLRPRGKDELHAPSFPKRPKALPAEAFRHI